MPGLYLRKMQPIITDYPYFFTATINKWKPLFQHDPFKDIIVESLRFLVKGNRIRLFSFVIMINHIHLIWQMMPGHILKNVQRDFLKYTAQTIQKNLHYAKPMYLEQFRVMQKDRDFNFWKRNSLNVELNSHHIYLQKLNYIHNNPVKAGLCLIPEDYYYSSAKFYQTGIDNWGFLSHHMG